MAYDEQIIKGALELIHKNKENAAQITAERREEVFSEFPEIKDVDDKIRRTAFELCGKLFSSHDTAALVENLKSENLELQARRESMLIKCGYGKDYLKAYHFCEDCQDTGFIGSKKCICLEKELRRLMYAASNLGGVLQSDTFDKFSLSFYSQTKDTRMGLSPRQNMQNLLQHLVEYCEEFSGIGESILFFGGTGLGKTFLSTSMALRIMDRGFSVLYYSAQTMFNKMEGVRFNKTGENESLFNVDFLIIDDLGAEFITSFTVSSLYDIVNTRLCGGKPTLISTNLGPEDIAKQYGERLGSRIWAEFKLLPFFGEDIRRQKKLNRKN